MSGKSKVTKTVGIRLPVAVVAELEEKAAARKLTLTNYLRDRIIKEMITRSHHGSRVVKTAPKTAPKTASRKETMPVECAGDAIEKAPVTQEPDSQPAGEAVNG